MAWGSEQWALGVNMFSGLGTSIINGITSELASAWAGIVGALDKFMADLKAKFTFDFSSLNPFKDKGAAPGVVPNGGLQPQTFSAPARAAGPLQDISASTAKIEAAGSEAAGFILTGGSEVNGALIQASTEIQGSGGQVAGGITSAGDQLVQALLLAAQAISAAAQSIGAAGAAAGNSGRSTSASNVVARSRGSLGESTA
jgi:hypothetical protein